MNKKSAKFKLGLLCGGPSLERGISLNSARSVMDHLQSDEIEIYPIYFDYKKRAYQVSKNQLYSNTPSDFDFKLRGSSNYLNEKKLIELLKFLDITFPVMHGSFGEDGKIQDFLEKNNIPFIGTNATSCKKYFDKFKANNFIKEHGFFTLPSEVLKIYHNDHKEIIENFFEKNKIKRAVVKPASGGSSIGVFSVSSPEEALYKVKLLFSKRMDTRVVIEPFAQGIEFTMIIMENRFGLPVSLLPTEIETNYKENQIFDFRKKYLPTRQVTWHCPPRFSKEVIENIRIQGEQLFSLFKMNDFARFDGWVLDDGSIWFCDFNPISGMEQNSFLFQQGSLIGMTHSDVLLHILENACRRHKIKPPRDASKYIKERKNVNILMGGDNSERQVSLMSGTNVWLKLRDSKKYKPQPYLLNKNKDIWKLPYHLCLNHTVEEIEDNCNKYEKNKKKIEELKKDTRIKLGLPIDNKNKNEFFDPIKMNFNSFLEESDFIFIALHGGDGENGNLQNILDRYNINFNGPGEKVSRLCINKWATARFIDRIKIKGISSIPGKLIETKHILNFSDSYLRNFWKESKKDLNAKSFIIKPYADGCSSGIVHLYTSDDLINYLNHLRKESTSIPKNTFKNQVNIVEMPTDIAKNLILEKFIETDTLRVKNNKIQHRRKSDWVEITIGVLEKNKKIKALNPSITLIENEILTLEEKFQGGTGVNITPPPKNIISSDITKKTRKKIEELTEKLKIKGYSRIDAFLNIKTGDLLIIEINTLPGLTPSTVFYQQGLSEKNPIFPKELIETLVSNKEK